MGTQYRAGQKLTASLLTTYSAQSEDTTSRTTTGTSYGNASGGAFTAAVVVPSSGEVRVEMRSTQRNSGATNTITSWTGSGSSSGTVYNANDTAALIVGGTANQPVDLSYRLTGLIPGETLTVTMQHRVSAGTGTFDYRHILLDGKP
ncbi:hypothetical protein ACFWG6_30810 [Streptomyces erythrochromogenes]|uniref:hypothetical protein n=1 Tax=Streptomyces erythrochromogenes TaxID=285574 RepID=UPI0036382B26